MNIKGMVLNALRWIWANIYKICAIVIAVTLVVICVDLIGLTHSVESTIGSTWTTGDYFKVKVNGIDIPDYSYELDKISDRV